MTTENTSTIRKKIIESLPGSPEPPVIVREYTGNPKKMEKEVQDSKITDPQKPSRSE